MAKIWVGPTGKLVQGHVLDASKTSLEEKLRDYDKQLYLKWNPKKLKGWGCWEIRRLPEKKSIKEVLRYKGASYVVLEFQELNLVNHVLDVGYINYDLVRKLKSMDMWVKHKDGTTFAHDHEYQEAKLMEAADKKALENTAYMAKQHKREINDFKELILSGMNPARIADYWSKK